MFSQKDLSRIVTAMRASRVHSLDIAGTSGALRISLRVQHADQLPSPMPAELTRIPIKSPALGRFVPCGLDDGLQAPSAGASISKFAVLGYVANDDLRVAVRAPSDGTLASSGPKTGQVIGFGDLLFEMEPAA